MRKILTFLSFFLFGALFFSSSFAASGDEAQKTETPLLVSEVTVRDINTVYVKFNQSVQSGSASFQLRDQKSNEVAKFEYATGSAMKDTVILKTRDPLVIGNSYILTILGITSESGISIKAGVDSIKEFTVPQGTPGTALSAPSNPNAVIVTSTGAKVSTGVNSPITAIKTSSGATGATIPTTGTLPDTGTEATLFVILAAVLAFVLVSRRKA